LRLFEENIFFEWPQLFFVNIFYYLTPGVGNLFYPLKLGTVRKAILLVFGLIIGFTVMSQVLVSDPSLPFDTQPVTILFNAEEGNGGLKDYTGDVYAHTGVLTTSSTASNDWKYVKTDWGENSPDTKLTPVPGEDDLYELKISPNIREYYGVPDGVTITHMAFVFRSAEPYSGSNYYEGKDTGGKDIFIEVFEEGLNVLIITPENTLIEETNQDISLSASSSFQADLTLFLNDTEVKSTTGDNITHTFNFANSGDYWLKVTADDGESFAADSVFIHILGTQPTAGLPQDYNDGINYIDANSVGLVLYAPFKEYIFVIGDFNNWTPSSDYRMNLDGNRYWLNIDGLEAGKEYAYQYFVDGTLKIGDPYADKVLDPWNDKWIAESTYPNLKPYPEGLTEGIVTVFQTAQSEYEWKYEFTPPEPEDLVIYELLVRDFIAAHDWKTLTDTLDYFTRLGVNAIELMPFNEFEGNESWGYNPSYYFAPDKYYGPKEDLKAFIDSAHNRGIAVIMDIVFNHSFGQSPLVQLYWNDQMNQPAANNPWYNEVSPNPVFAWGYDFDHESQATRDFMDRANAYWLTEYNIDGFRFDFTKGFTNTPGDGGAYDAARIAILKRMADEIWKVNPDAYVILEHFADNAEEIDLSDYGMMIWGNMNYNYNEASMGYHDSGKSDFSGVSYQKRGWNEPLLVGYMESHDEERLMFKNLEYGNSLGEYDITELSTALFRVELAAAFFFTVPGPKMIWQFGEMGYDFSIDYNGRVGNKPIRWDYYNSRDRLREVFATFIHLRRSEPAFSTDDYTLSVRNPLKRIELNHEDMDVRIIGNFDVTEGNIAANFSRTGTWYDFMSGEVINVSDVNMTFTLDPGEYKILTTKQFETPELPTSIKELYTRDNALLVYPNPVKDILFFSNEDGIRNIRILDMSGRMVYNRNIAQDRAEVNLENLNKGIYLVEIVDNKNNTRIEKIVKQ
jgi:glycosidase